MSTRFMYPACEASGLSAHGEKRIAHVSRALAAQPCTMSRYIRLGNDGTFECASWLDHSED